MRWIVGIDEVGHAAKKRRASSCRYVVGIDEVGRGSLAGPVVVAAFAAPQGFAIRNRALGALRDSKQLTERGRGLWFEYFRGHPKVHYALARVYQGGIDRINITKAANLAAFRAFSRLLVHMNSRRKVGTPTGASALSPLTCSIYLDGGLYLGNGLARLPARTVVRGDEKIAAIKAASIIAKVHRDRFMRRLAKKFPGYGFEIHKGYGTRLHLARLKRHGPSEAHRKTFVKFIK